MSEGQTAEQQRGSQPSQRQQGSDNDSRKPQQQQMSMIDELLDSKSFPSAGAAVGILCNDPSGLCLSARGSIDGENSGAFTCLVRLASQLQQQQQQQQPSSLDQQARTDPSSGSSGSGGTSAGGGGPNSSGNGSSGGGATKPSSNAPLITIEYETSAILVKEYHQGYAVALRVPANAAGTGSIARKDGGKSSDKGSSSASPDADGG